MKSNLQFVLSKKMWINLFAVYLINFLLLIQVQLSIKCLRASIRHLCRTIILMVSLINIALHNIAKRSASRIISQQRKKIKNERSLKYRYLQFLLKYFKIKIIKLLLLSKKLSKKNKMTIIGLLYWSIPIKSSS